jgi:hypothetical protein
MLDRLDWLGFSIPMYLTALNYSIQDCNGEVDMLYELAKLPGFIALTPGVFLGPQCGWSLPTIATSISC